MLPSMFDPEELTGKRVTVGPKTTLGSLLRRKTPRAYTRRVSPGLYTARSHTRRGRRHYVYVNLSGVTTCSCEAYSYDKTCWAMKAVARRLLRNRRELEEVAAR